MSIAKVGHVAKQCVAAAISSIIAIKDQRINIAHIHTLAQCISKMEKKLDTALFIRSTKSVRLSDAGMTFFSAAEKIITLYDEALESIENISSTKISTFRVAFLGSAFYQDFPIWIPNFKNAYPEVGVYFQVMNAPKFFSDVENGLIDVGFCRKIEIKKMYNVHFEPLICDRIQIVANKDSPIASKSSVSLEELKDTPFIIVDRSVSPNYYDKIISMCASVKFKPRFVQTVSSTNDIYPMINSKLGAAFLPSSCNYYNLPNLRCVDIDGVEQKHLELEAGAIWKNSNKNPNIFRLIKIIRDSESARQA